MAFTSSAGFPGGNLMATSVALGDVDGDGRLDVVVSNSYRNHPNQLQQSDGSFVAAAGFPGGATTDPSGGTTTDPRSVAMGHVDGRLDMLGMGGNRNDYGENGFGTYHAANELLLQQSDGSFVAAAGFPYDPPGWAASPYGVTHPRSAALGDVNGDGRLDVLVGIYNGANQLLLQQSDGSFVALAGFPGGNANTRSVALGDVDGDGRLDVLVGNFGGANELLLQ